tara:strand:+ start:81 stop:224 length:144 start_codon:yes stop_codon:yes gene_type:complete
MIENPSREGIKPSDEIVIIRDVENPTTWDIIVRTYSEQFELEVEDDE